MLPHYRRPIFISYSRKQTSYALKLVGRLEKEGFSAWIDRSGIRVGNIWPETIKQAVKDCAALIVVVTPDSVQSEWVNKEVDFAYEMKKPILPICLEGYHWSKLQLVQHCDVFSEEYPPDGFFDDLAQYSRRFKLDGNNATWIAALISLSDKNDRNIEDNLVATLASFGVGIIPQLIDAIDSSSATRRLVAYETLVSIGAEGVPQLITALEHPNSWIVRKVATILSRIQDERAINPLVALLGRHIGDVAVEIASAIKNLGLSSFLPVVQRLSDSNPSTVWQACWVLQDLSNPEAIPYLKALLPHPNKHAHDDILKTIKILEAL